MKVKNFKTHLIQPNESLLNIIYQHISKIPNQSILVITSKILSLCQNRIIAKTKVLNKQVLIEQEAEQYLAVTATKYPDIYLTIKQNILIPNAGIDESNGNECYILYPLNIQAEVNKIWQACKEQYQITKLGVIITDSHTTPLRRGVTGIALAWCGFKPLHDYIGSPDLFGNKLRVTKLNIVDSLAAAAVFCMGEGNEQTPLALITETEKIVFQEQTPSAQELAEVTIPLQEDIYAPLLTNIPWKTKGL